MANEKALVHTPYFVICGEHFRRLLQFHTAAGVPVPVNPADFKAQIRGYQSPDAPLIAELAFTAGPETNELWMQLADEITVTITPGDYYYDVKSSQGNEPKVYLRGPFKFEACSTT